LAYRLWICDQLDEIRSRGLVVPVVQKLESWFSPIARTAGFNGCECIFAQYIVQPAAHELLVCVCPAHTSVLQHKPGLRKATFPDPTTSPHQGVTDPNAPAGSEIWMKVSSVDAIASLIFHECMHNKLQVGNRLHNMFNPQQDPCHLSCASITWPTAPTATEEAAMAAALGNAVPQWTDGQRILRRARLRRKAGDPLWDDEIQFRRP
jgi:hypothetical protein